MEHEIDTDCELEISYVLLVREKNTGGDENIYGKGNDQILCMHSFPTYVYLHMKFSC